MSYRVGLNAHLLSSAKSYRGAGINGYIYQLLRHLPEVDQDLQLRAFFHDPAFQVSPGMEAARSHLPTTKPWRRILWEQTALPFAARQLDLLHGLAFASPLVVACPTIVTVHDLSFLRFPAAFRPLNRIYLSYITRWSVRRASRVIAVSECTRRDVVSLLGAPEQCVVTVPNGVTEDFCPATPHAVAEFRERRGLPGRFILFLGTLEPRKNLTRLVDAYAAWRRASGDEVKLVIAGAQGWYYEQVFARVVEHDIAGDVMFPGFVPAEELPWWYRAAEVFVYPSVFEGFGLPVLEALACGTPVITSNTSSLPEVAGDSALLVDPLDSAALAAALDSVLASPTYAAELRERGPLRAAAFTWLRTAQDTAAVYRAVLEAPREA